MDHATIDKLFTHHPPKPGQPDRYQAIRNAAKHLGHVILESTPEGPDQSTAIRKLREVVMTANAAIALEDESIPVQLQSVAAMQSPAVCADECVGDSRCPNIAARREAERKG